jgi:hypothetical protein
LHSLVSVGCSRHPNNRLAFRIVFFLTSHFVFLLVVQVQAKKRGQIGKWVWCIVIEWVNLVWNKNYNFQKDKSCKTNIFLYYLQRCCFYFRIPQIVLSANFKPTMKIAMTKNSNKTRSYQKNRFEDNVFAQCSNIKSELTSEHKSCAKETDIGIEFFLFYFAFCCFSWRPGFVLFWIKGRQCRPPYCSHIWNLYLINDFWTTTTCQQRPVCLGSEGNRCK